MGRRPVTSGLSHVSPQGGARMVDVSGKNVTERTATAEAWVTVGPLIAGLLRESGSVAKGDVLGTARLAGILAAKRTSELIPMCHPLAIDLVELEAELEENRVRLVARVACDGKTGVEMEALTAAAIAALTVYDMVKSAGKEVEIGPVRLLEKTGGKSGHWRREGHAGG
ncbi:MAG: cyclic pyranopterin monophosphate synthase MoaC [Bryobacterales bacterium]|nr:cyclic pyranopterin monophosphate synthase MoaC [Bryobacterales bacterium]